MVSITTARSQIHSKSAILIAATVSTGFKRDASYRSTNYIFYHGQRRQYLLSEKIYTDLLKCINPNIPEEFLYLHVKQLKEQHDDKIYNKP